MKKPTPQIAWLKEAAFNIGSLLGNLFLIILALVLFVPLFIVAMPWKVWVSFTRDNRKAREILSGTGKFFVGIAIAIDQLGNVAFAGLFNDVLVKDASIFAFGRTHETISEVLGWNEYLKNLTSTGKFLVAAVNFFDFTKEQHCAHAMASGIDEAKYKIAFQKKALVQHETIIASKEFMAKY
ncbi:hypothetical protein [Salinimicrobium sp. WS361]|uniref:hypothetical protein n=1 Tax=Salinimicrobium sp. WS361 TaxID=3425123 RepID=UPI003D6E9049